MTQYEAILFHPQVLSMQLIVGSALSVNKFALFRTIINLKLKPNKTISGEEKKWSLYHYQADKKIAHLAKLLLSLASTVIVVKVLMRQ